MKYLLVFFFSLMLLPLNGCGGLPVQEIPLAQPELPPEDSQPSPIAFRKIHFAVPTGNPTLSQSPKGPLGLIICSFPYGMVHSGISGRSFPSDDYRRIFSDTLDGQGYDVAGNPGRMFDEDEDRKRSHYSLGARITDVKIDVCRKKNFWGIDRGETGEAEITITWTAFDTLHRKVVYKKEHKGYARNQLPNHENTPLLLEMAFQASVHNLGADREFYDLVFNGIEPNHNVRANYMFDEEYDSIFDPLEEVLLPPKPISILPADNRLEEVRKAAVMIQTGSGHGSGFFVSDDGHIITNAHVIGRANRVRVVVSGKRKKQTAEVLRYDRRRDVALLKLEELPEKYEIHTLPIRTDKLVIGETVYAIGAPFQDFLQDTVTKGIVSAHRYNKTERQRYIQADVYITGGNSGGPLIDGNGNIVGITVSHFVRGIQELSGLNNFIPIDDALDQLDIEIEEAD